MWHTNWQSGTQNYNPHPVNVFFLLHLKSHISIIQAHTGVSAVEKQRGCMCVGGSPVSDGLEYLSKYCTCKRCGPGKQTLRAKKE